MRNRLLASLSVALVGTANFAAAATASCLPATAAEHRAHASVIFDGVALEGPTGTGIQRFKVARYLKGHGPKTVRVNTGFIKHADGSGTLTSVSLVVHRGEHWRIFSRDAPPKVMRTSQCDGSTKR